ncbi:transposase [Streptomyces sp. NPDC094143]|uniref:transposase n=1 Tax=Streptomyces sp. NPDC094143 TaxID=3155310 RepID=UPI003319BFCD
MPLTDAQWARIEPLLQVRTPKRGGRRRDHREVIDAIAFQFQTGTQWVHLRQKYGNWRAVCNRLRMWAVDGTWERVFTALMAQADADEGLPWVVSVDSSVVRAQQHAGRVPQEGGTSRRPGRPRHRMVPRRTDHDVPPRGRRQLPTPRIRSHRKTGRRCTELHPMSWHACAFPGEEDGPAPDRTRSRRTRPVRPAQSAPTCASAASGR